MNCVPPTRARATLRCSTSTFRLLASPVRSEKVTPEMLKRNPTMATITESTQILVIGGGPGGATAATLLARGGCSGTLLERDHFPRYHIGESLLPTILPILDLIGARDKVEAFGFQRKQGAFLEWGPEQWSLNFGELSGNCTS